MSMERIAVLMLDDSLKVIPNDNLLVVYNPGGIQLADIIKELVADRKINVRFQCEDPLADAEFLLGLDPHPMVDAFDEIVLPRRQNAKWATKFAMIGCNDNPNAMAQVPGETIQALRSAQKDLADIRAKKEYVITALPTEAEAKLDGMPYESYVDLYFRACDRDWKEVEEAQDILIQEVLNPGKKLEFFADQTFLSMGIGGQTFANSTIFRNIPGSEVFTGPVRGTVNGRLTLPYPLMFRGKIIPNLTLQFIDGKVLHFDTDGGDNMSWVERVLTDSGTREAGEVALGTNSILNRPMLNPLFVEKVGGSFHIALGRAYTYTNYAGREVKVDNGVTSANHIDLTRLMLSDFGGGRVSVDGKIIQWDGRFVDKRLAILNPE